MKKSFNFTATLFMTGCCMFVAMFAAQTVHAATVKGQSVVQTGVPTVRTRVAASGIYNQSCYDTYYGCMDQFCVGDSNVLNIPGEPVTIDGGTCACSDTAQGLKDKIATMNQRLDQANALKTIEVEKVEAGAKADIVFTGTREYDKDGNVVKLDAAKKAKQQEMLSLWDNSEFDPFAESETETSIANQSGAALYKSAHQMCVDRMPVNCAKDINLLTSLYSTQIKSDCKAFENTVSKMQVKVDAEYAAAEKAVRTARLASFDSANEYDSGTCMLNFRKCMTGPDVCGSDWTKCVGFIASENMQNSKRTNNVSRQNVNHVVKYEIADTTMEMLNAKRNICENVLDKCVVVRDGVWDNFLREVAPSLKLAELNAESNLRQSCLTDISGCIQKACKDDIAGNGVATMDSCLSRPDMARSFCKIQIETCERMEPLIWGYVKDKLASMRVDRCTQEVKTCFTDRCGSDFSQCVGMDYDYMHSICPLDKLVVCKQNNPKFSMSDLDSMLMGLYLNVDNAALENCQNLVDAKMLEICGSTTDCNKFAADDTIGTGSLQPQKDGNIYRITGMISFGSIRMGDANTITSDGKNTLAPGQIDINEYIAKARAQNADVANAQGILSSIDSELNNIAGTINRTIELIDQDPKIQYCISGRNLSQITGKDMNTSARFPNLLNQTKILIAASALRKAQDNYNTKFNNAVADATKNASADVAQYMCQMMPMNGGAVSNDSIDTNAALAQPYAISYDISSGLTADQLLKGGHDKTTSQGFSVSNASGGNASGVNGSWVGGAAGIVTDSVTRGIQSLATSKYRVNTAGGYKEMWSLFNRDTRTCHYCSITVTKNCTTKGSRGFLGLWDSRGVDCKETKGSEVCKDIEM